MYGYDGRSTHYLKGSLERTHAMDDIVEKMRKSDKSRYKNVFANPALVIDVEDRVKIADGEKQNTEP